MRTLESRLSPFFHRMSASILHYRPAFFEKTSKRRNWWADKTFATKWFISKDIIEKGVLGGLAAMYTVFTVRQQPSQPANENPFWHDSYSQGHYITSDTCVMFDSKGDYVKIIDIPTGQIIKVDIKR